MTRKVIIQAHASTDENEIIGVKEQITAALEHFGCTVEFVNVMPGERKEAPTGNGIIQDRYNHLQKAYGSFDPYTRGFAECMRLVMNAGKENK